MIVLALTLLVIILIVLLSFRTKMDYRFQQVEQELIALRKELAQQKITTEVLSSENIVAEKPVEKQQTQWKPDFEVMPEPTPSFHQEKPSNKEAQKTAFNKEKKDVPEPTVVTQPAAKPTPASRPHKPSFFERNPDLEKFIGENLVSKIGIAILVLAIGYFVKYAIDNEWIGTIGRVSVGIVCGGILIAIAHKLRNNYHAFSSVLAGGGLAIFYFTITLAFQQYHLFSQTVAFIIMLAITAFAVLLALLYNRQELAVIALSGGFAAPFLISNGSGNYVTLFVYLVVLNTGLLLIAYNKSWRLLNTTAFVFTVILFASWLYTLTDAEPATTYANALLFLIAFYVLFLAVTVANNIKENKQFIAFDFSLLLANTGLFFGAGLYCLHRMNAANYNGLFSAATAVFNLVLSYILFRKRNIDTNILYLLIGITLTFVSLTAPLQLHGHFITLFWASEAVLLYWLYTKSDITLVQYAALIIYACMLISLLGDWWTVYHIQTTLVSNNKQPLPIIINRGFITGFYTAAASYCMCLIGRKHNSVAWLVKAVLFQLAALLILFLAGNIEISYQFNHYFSALAIAPLYQQLFSFLFILIVLFVNDHSKAVNLTQKTQFLLLVSCALVYFFTLPFTTMVLNDLTSPKYELFHSLFIAHWGVALLTAMILYKTIGLRISLQPGKQKDFIWILSSAIVIFFSAEMYFITLNIFYKNTTVETINRVYIKAVLPVLWGLCSFGFMWLGMKYKVKTLRVISLSLFLLTLLKLFAYDISNIPVAGKIIAFFCLGILLLIISFMYQRLKKIIIEDEVKPGI